MFSHSRSNPAERIYRLKREVLELHDAVGPLVQPVDRLAVGAPRARPRGLQAYFRDVHDHLLRGRRARPRSFRDLLTSVLGRQPDPGRACARTRTCGKISAWVAIVAIPTMIAGIYGMNFGHMPELDSSYGYPLVLGVMLAACASLYTYFRRIGWL